MIWQGQGEKMMGCLYGHCDKQQFFPLGVATTYSLSFARPRSRKTAFTLAFCLRSGFQGRLALSLPRLNCSQLCDIQHEKKFHRATSGRDVKPMYHNYSASQDACLRLCRSELESRGSWTSQLSAVETLLCDDSSKAYFAHISVKQRNFMALGGEILFSFSQRNIKGNARRGIESR